MMGGHHIIIWQSSLIITNATRIPDLLKNTMDSGTELYVFRLHIVMTNKEKTAGKYA